MKPYQIIESGEWIDLENLKWINIYAMPDGSHMVRIRWKDEDDDTDFRFRNREDAEVCRDRIGLDWQKASHS
jgi:hypothetical protein